MPYTLFAIDMHRGCAITSAASLSLSLSLSLSPVMTATVGHATVPAAGQDTTLCTTHTAPAGVAMTATTATITMVPTANGPVMTMTNKDRGPTHVYSNVQWTLPTYTNSSV